MGKFSARLGDFFRTQGGAVAAEYAMLIAGFSDPSLPFAAGILGDSMTLVLNDAADCVEVGCT